jgi:hypothetical protein
MSIEGYAIESDVKLDAITLPYKVHEQYSDNLNFGMFYNLCSANVQKCSANVRKVEEYNKPSTGRKLLSIYAVTSE